MADAEQKKQCGNGSCCNGQCTCTKDVHSKDCEHTTPSCCAAVASASCCTDACQSGFTCITGQCKRTSTCECPECKSCCGGKENAQQPN